MEQKQDFRHLVRIGNTDLDGNKHTYLALTRIKGVGFPLANAICNIAKLEKSKKIGDLKEQEIQLLDDVLKNPSKYSIPVWMFNRRSDPEDGKDKHLVTSDLIFAQESDIKMMKKIKSYKGIRHMLGLPVRGQRTRSHFRKNKGKVHLGVQRSKTAKPGKT